MNENFSFCMAAEGAAGKHLTSSGHPADLKPGNSGSPFAKKRVKRLWLKWRSPESPPTQDKCVTASLIPRGSSQVWQQSQNIGWINRSGQAELPAEDEETSPLFYLCQWKQTVENWPALWSQSMQRYEVTLPIWPPQWPNQQKFIPSMWAARGTEVMPQLSTGGKRLPLVFHQSVTCSSIIQHPHILISQ